MNSPDDLTAERLAQRWGVALEPPSIETASSTIRFGRRAGRSVACKVYEAGSDERLGGEALRHFAGLGAVAVLEAAADGMLLERLAPGHELTVPDDAAATHVFCDLALRLHAAGPPPEGFPTIGDWGKGFQRHRLSGAGGIPARLLADAQALFGQLCDTQAEAVLLHGDLHHYNILFDEALGWTVIDPKGVIGEPAFEVGAFLRNPDDCALDAAVLNRRLDILAGRLGHDRARMLAWHFAQAVLSAIWCIEDGGDATGALRTAAVAREML